MTTERYYLKADHQTEWNEVTRKQFINAEQAAGFRSKFGPNHPATGGFTGGGMRGRIEYVTEQPRPEQAGGEAGEQSQLFPRYSFAVVTGRYKILDNRSDSEPRVRQIATADGEDEARIVVRALNAAEQHSTLIAQRERLLRLLRPVTSPTACYCAVMGSEKCWHCEARELITTIEQEGTEGQ